MKRSQVSSAGLRRCAALALFAVAAVAAAATPAQAGPPWIAVEYPANPLHEDTRGALLLVHTFHHGVARSFPLVGHAEGIVDGRRVRRDLAIRATYRPGVHAVRGDLHGGTAWVLVLTMTDGETGVRRSALVALNGERALTAVDIPHATIGEWSEQGAVTAAQVDRFLQTSIALAAVQPAVGRVSAANEPGAEGAGAMLAGLVLVPLVVLGVRRARRDGRA